jgi:hypothetical protein
MTHQQKLKRLTRFTATLEGNGAIFPIDPNKTPLYLRWQRLHSILERFTLFYEAQLVSRNERSLYDRIFWEASRKESSARYEMQQEREQKRRENFDW